jgi:hypothetical protein
MIMDQLTAGLLMFIMASTIAVLSYLRDRHFGVPRREAVVRTVVTFFIPILFFLYDPYDDE